MFFVVLTELAKYIHVYVYLCSKLHLTQCEGIFSQLRIFSATLCSGKKLVLISSYFIWDLLNYLFSEPDVPTPHITACLEAVTGLTFNQPCLHSEIKAVWVPHCANFL